MSDGSKSGVNWIRLNCESIDRANALARVVLPVPGKSSSNTCPPLASAASSLRVAFACPCMIRAMLAAIFWYTSRPVLRFSESAGALAVKASIAMMGEVGVIASSFQPLGHATTLVPTLPDRELNLGAVNLDR